MIDDSARHVYRTSNQQVLKAWAETQRQNDEYMTRREDQFEAWGFPRDITVYSQRGSFGGGPRLVGLQWDEGREVPKYWRRDRNTPDMIVPRSRGAGVRIAQEFAKITSYPNVRADLSKLGMPDMVMRGVREGMAVFTYAAARADDVVWVLWTIDPNPVEGDENRRPRPKAVDDTIWELVKLSEYYAMVEAGDDPFEVKERENA